MYARGLEQAQAAEEPGYRSVWLGEHHFSTCGHLSSLPAGTLYCCQYDDAEDWHCGCSYWFGKLSQARMLKSMELFAKEVMPALA